MGKLDERLLLDGVSYADQWITYQQHLRDIPGVVVAIRYGDELLLSKAYGLADLAQQSPMTPQHIFRVASHSKTFTATAIMQLVEQGKLRLDDCLDQHVPWLEPGEGLARATVRQVLNHAAGIIRDGGDADFWQLERPFPDSAELRRLVEDGGEVLATNDIFKYSNIGYSLLGMVVEATSGMPYNQYVTEHIVRRLGLPDTGPEFDKHARERLATGYTRAFLGFPRMPLPDVETAAMSPATGFYSTAADLCRYASAHFLGNDALLSDASKREMQQPYWTIEQSDERYGLGFAISTIGDREMVGHGGAFPGHATKTMFDPHARLAVVVLTNETGGPAKTLATAIVKIIDFALRQSTAPAQASYQRFTGRFVNLWGVTDIAQFGNALVMLSPDPDDPVKEVTELEVVDQDTLRITKTGGYGSPGQTVRYLRDESGRLTRIINAGLSTYPEEVYRERLRARRDSGKESRQPGLSVAETPGR